MLGRSAAANRADSHSRLSGAPLGRSPSFLLARANARSLALGNDALASLGLKVRSYSVLALASGGDNPSQRELATFLRLDPSQVVALVDDLERRRLVERLTDPNDRRANVVRGTAEGRALAAKAAAALEDVDDLVFEGLSLAEREKLADMLDRVAFRP